MKKQVTLVLACIFLSLFVACSDTEQRPEVTEGVETQNNLTQQPKPTEAEVLSGLSQSMTNSESENLLQGIALENLTVVGEDGEYYCNLEENLMRTWARPADDYPVLVCKDPVYGITYYINYGRDYYVYAKRGDEVEKVLEIPAKDLFCRQGILYFRTCSYGLYEFDSFADGAVLAYNPVDGSVKIVIDEPVYEMVVYLDGIFYVEKRATMSEDGTVELSYGLWKYYYSFESGETTEYGKALKTPARWKENQLVIELIKGEGKSKALYKLETREGETAGELTSLTDALEARRTDEKGACYLETYRVQGDCIYYIDSKNDCFLCYDMVTGEEKKLVELGQEIPYERAFIIHNGAVYFCNGIKYSFAQDKQYMVKLKGKEYARIQNFYTDGEDMYVLADGQLYLYEEIKVDSYGNTNSFVIPGREVTYNCYEAILHTPGK